MAQSPPTRAQIHLPLGQDGSDMDVAQDGDFWPGVPSVGAELIGDVKVGGILDRNELKMGNELPSITITK